MTNTRALSTSALLLCSFLTCAVVLGSVSEARADLYRYLNKDGSVLITTEPRSDLKLLEAMRDGSSSPRRKKPRGKAKPNTKVKRKPKAARGAAKHHENSFDAIILEAARAYELPPAFIKGVIRVESNFNPNAVSRVGAMGLMQLMPNTASYLGVEDAFDPRQNIFGGAKLLRILTNQYNGDINLLLSAYNAGGGTVARHGGIPYKATQDYVRNVYKHYKRYQGEGAFSSGSP